MVTERDCQNLAAPRNGSRVPDTETVASGSSLRLSCDIGFYYKGESTQTTCHNGSFIMDISESVCAGKLAVSATGECRRQFFCKKSRI